MRTRRSPTRRASTSSPERGARAPRNLDIPPPEKPKRPLTRHGYTQLSAERDQLLLVERPKVVQGIATAAAEGDRSENAEYIYGKKRLRELDKRLRYLGMLLKDVKIVDPERLSGERVAFGSTVSVRDEDGNEREYIIVGEGERDFHESAISFESPVARVLIGKRVGDVVLARRPAGEMELEIIGLSFGGHGAITSAPGTPRANIGAMRERDAAGEDEDDEEEEKA